jgi:hypothetical protein
MKSITAAALVPLLTLACVLGVTPARSQEKQEKKDPPRPTGQSQPAPPSSTPAVAAPIYKPPLRGAPGGRVGGGTRGTGRETFVLAVLAPQHTGQTTQEQPSLYWFISSPTSSAVELTVIDAQGTQPLVETRIAPPIQPGVHRIRLAEYGVRLTPGVAYRWFIAVVADSGRRSKDVLAGGSIERVEAPRELSVKLASVPRDNLPFLYAEAGFWYDAVTALSELIEAEPQNAALRKQRAALLVQVGLPEISE